MEVILLERVGRLGQMGDTVNVKDGFARNFLLPQGKALRATTANKKRFENERAQLEARNLEAKQEAEKLAERIEGQTFIIIRQAGETGHLYGSVATRDIAEVVTEGGFSLDKRQVLLDRPIKMLGLKDVPIQLHPEVEPTITINVARSEDEAERQARGEDVNRPLDEQEEERREALEAAEEFFEEGTELPEDVDTTEEELAAETADVTEDQADNESDEDDSAEASDEEEKS
ncbi:50S ribosomal protein L9 [Methyloligella halotolerans]|uniref:Large ribosomal subunit protein bL9 n=1 Tax=Methyloligella halotolerans TaxID=1177755 RepID=A0A1E2S1U4_9HYPH|nr:50S ribosomal protein L9 [Methyloligella halotolerans]ODA68414.1 50S ribosomal protein L9 [Methyloligella halotolerans]